MIPRRPGIFLRLVAAAFCTVLFLPALPAGAEDAAFAAELRNFERALDEIERSLFPAAASKSGSALQKDMEKRLSELSSQARRLQQAVNATAMRRNTNFSAPVDRLNNIFVKLRQGKERPVRGMTLRRTSSGEFHRTKRSDITKIRKQEGSEEEKAAAIEDLYDEWLSTVKNDNLRRCGRVASDNLRALYEDYALAIFDLRHLLREFRRSKMKHK